MIFADKLKCEYQFNPLGIETDKPELSWRLNSSENGVKQTAYKILISSTSNLLKQNIGDIWDSGEVDSNQSLNIISHIKQCKSGQRCLWKVRVSDNSNKWSEWSDPAVFEIGLLNKQNWIAQWISASGKEPNMLPDKPEPAPYFRKVFSINEKISQARIYISGLGYYKLYICGEKIGDEVLSPAVTYFDKTVLYDIFDVTESIRNKNEIVLGIILGNGWYNTFTDDVWNFKQAPWRHFPKVILQLHLLYENGNEDIIVSDNSWKYTTGPIVFDGLRNGEHYDARLEIDNWNTIDYNDSNWNNASITRSPGGIMRASQMPPIKVISNITPVSVTEIRNGIYLYDLGQSISGWVNMQLKNTQAGEEIILKYGEKLDDQGDLYTSDIDYLIKSGEFQTDRYTTKGSDSENWEPSFTYHGFRYVQLSGYSGKVGLNTVQGKVVHTALEQKGSFSCSDNMLNKIQQCAVWSTLTNYHGIPTDCPHREKNGWTGDALLSAEQVLLNFDPVTAYRKWMQDFIDSQRSNGQIPGIIPASTWGYNWGSGPAWDSAIILIPWYMYIYANDKKVLELMFEPMLKYLDFMNSMEIEEGIVDYGLGDWCSPSRPSAEPKCPVVLTDTAYYYTDCMTFSKIAKILGKTNISKIFLDKAEQIKNAFRNKFFNKSTGEILSNCQTAYSCSLYQGLIEENEIPMVLNQLSKEIEKQNFHIDTGILGSKYILHTLSNLDKSETAYSMVKQKDYPGWGYWIKQGATTLWEYWDGTKSRNHHMFSDISAWFYKGLAGIIPDPNKPGFKNIIFKPSIVSGIEWLEAWHESPYGLIKCNWTILNKAFTLTIIIPVNCTGVVVLPEIMSNKGIIITNSSNVELKEGEYWVKDGEVIKFDSGEYKLCMDFEKI